METKIYPVDGISIQEIERALRAKKLYFFVRTRWCPEGGGFERTEFSVFKKKKDRSILHEALPYGDALTRAIMFNSNRTWSDPRIQKIRDAAEGLPKPPCGETHTYVWHRKSGVLARCK